MLGKLTHYLFDAVLVSICLAGIKRSTGLSPALTKLKNKDIRQLIAGYLEMGEWAMDLTIVVMGRSNYFVRNR
ncbi:hypothetical protein JCM11491_001544 [Sporobolomyces phaffii]